VSKFAQDVKEKCHDEWSANKNFLQNVKDSAPSPYRVYLGILFFFFYLNPLRPQKNWENRFLKI